MVRRVDATAGPALAAAGLLAVGALGKVADPTDAAGAVRSVGLPASGLAVRLGALAELVIAAAAVVAGGGVAWGLVAASYAGFTAFVVLALARDGAIASCGCLGRRPTPPTVAHVIATVVLGAGAAGAAVTGSGGLATWPWSELSTWLVLGFAAITGWLAWIVVTALPGLQVARTAEVSRGL